MKRGSPLRRANSPQAKRPKIMEKSPSQRDKNGFMVFVLNCGGQQAVRFQNKKNASLESTAGRKNKLRRSLRRIICFKKSPENNKCFRDINPRKDRTGPVVITFYYPDYTVGLGISPSHALCSDNLSRRYKRLVGFTTDREFTCTSCVRVSPCPEGLNI